MKTKLRDKLRQDKGEKTWDAYLQELQDTYKKYRKVGDKMGENF